MTKQSIPLSEQIAAVERVADSYLKASRTSGAQGETIASRRMKETADRLAAALATLRGLLLIEETR